MPNEINNPKMNRFLLTQTLCDAISIVIGILLGTYIGIDIALRYIDSLPRAPGEADYYRVQYAFRALLVGFLAGSSLGGLTVYKIIKWRRNWLGNKPRQDSINCSHHNG
jgi:hypothetical protein